VTLCGWAAVSSGCALLSKGEVAVPRYFSPDLPAPATSTPGPRSAAELRLGRVTAGTHLGERLVYRTSDVELGFYDDRLWTEKPASYLRRALSRVFFEERGLQSSLSGNGATLEVELVSFEEVLKPKHVARVELSFSLRDDQSVRMQESLTVEKPIASGEKKADAAAKAMSEALNQSVAELATRVTANLDTKGKPLCPCPADGAPQ
jgi:ABC-type uncharacterized transport system auxiliary subunit